MVAGVVTELLQRFAATVLSDGLHETGGDGGVRGTLHSRLDEHAGGGRSQP